MICFLSTESEQKLDQLRKLLEQNTLDIVDLFLQRSALARRIGELKEENSIPIRIRKRENELLGSLSGLNELSRAIISTLFEFTITNEESKTNSAGRKNDGTIELDGSQEALEIVSGLLFASPGVEVYCSTALPTHLEWALQAKGAHIIFEETSDPDLTIGIGIDDECGVVISNNGKLKINSSFLGRPGPLKIQVRTG